MTMSLSIIRLDLGEGHQIFFEIGDITEQSTDAIVNAANSSLLGGGGVDGAIHRAGGPDILEACQKIVARDGHLPPGEAVETTGGKLPAAFVIHTVGPIYKDGFQGEAGILAAAYRNSFRLADRLGLETLAFPSISTGAYHYPPQPAAETAVATIVDEFVEARSLREVHFVLFSPELHKIFVDIAHALGEHRKMKRWSFVALSDAAPDAASNT